MRVLGCDPGVVNLGLAVVEFSDTGGAPVVLWSQDMHAGSMDNPSNYATAVVPYLDNVYADWKFDFVAAEEPPILTPTRPTSRANAMTIYYEACAKAKTGVRISRVFGIVDGWAVAHRIERRYTAPTTIKARARKLLGITDPKRTEKAMIREAVEKIIGGKACRTSHENDAVFAAWVCYGAA